MPSEVDTNLDPHVEDEPTETAGPLAVERLRKDDGRQLILYTRRDLSASDQTPARR